MMVCLALRLRPLEFLVEFEELSIWGYLLLFLLSCMTDIIKATTTQKTTTIGTPMINNITQSAAILVYSYEIRFFIAIINGNKEFLQ